MNTKNLMNDDPAKDDLLILVDALDRQTGTASKMDAHLQGLLHRAFSVVLMREGPAGPETLLSQRAKEKYHSGGLWANACCSHPRAGEDLFDAAHRRVREELGCEVADLVEKTAFVYRAQFDGGLCEFEYDHVLIGKPSGELAPNPAEVMAVRWVSVDALATELEKHPERFSAWAPMVLSMAMAAYRR